MPLAEPAVHARPHALSLEQVHAFHDQGYLGPFTLCSPGEMATVRAHIDEHVLTGPGPNARNNGHCRHLDRRVLWDLIRRDELVAPAASLLGPDLVCWSSNFWCKEPSGKEIPWHQDFQYWPMDPPLNVTAWIAVDCVTRENSCVRIIPGSHKTILPEIATTAEQIFEKRSDPARIDESQAVEMPLDPGQFFVFSERLLHQSHANHSKLRRMGMAVRLTTPFVKLYHDQVPLFEGHRAVLLSGADRAGLNRYQVTPPAR